MSKRSRSPPPPASLPLSRSSPSLSSGNLRPNRVASESRRIVSENEKSREDVQNTIKESDEANVEDKGDKEAAKKAAQEELEKNESPGKTAPAIGERITTLTHTIAEHTGTV